MLTPKRINYWAKLEPGQVYHLYNHAVGSDNLFREQENYRFFLQQWQWYFGQYMDLYAYCLMPNHFHVLGRLKPLSEAVNVAIRLENTAKSQAFLRGEVPVNVFYEDQFKRFFTSYSRAYGKAYQRIGSLFRAKFKRVLIQDREHLLDKLMYIHHNPIHHGFCAGYAEYPYSSYHEYVAGNAERVHLPILKYFEGGGPGRSFRTTQSCPTTSTTTTTSTALDGFVQAHEAYRLDFRGDVG